MAPRADADIADGRKAPIQFGSEASTADRSDGSSEAAWDGQGMREGGRRSGGAGMMIFPFDTA